MKKALTIVLALVVLSLTACQPQPKMIALGGASDTDLAAVARIQEGTMLLRGVDRQLLNLKQKTNPFSDVPYALTPGKHEVLAMSIQSGHVLPTEGMRCYIIKADLKAGFLYRLDEDRKKHRAILRRDDSGVEVAATDQMEQRELLDGVCNWK